MSDVSRILSQFASGDPSAAEHLLPLVYDELRKLAAQRLADEKPGQTLQATALVHDAYIRLIDVEVARQWTWRGPSGLSATDVRADPVVEQRLTVLLDAYEDNVSFLESPPEELASAAAADLAVGAKPGAQIGPYKLLEQLGEEGFGVVFKAQQSQPVKRQVALKVIKPGMDSGR